jgi:hypothetical protein
VVFVQPVVLALGRQAVRQLCYARGGDAVAKHHAATRRCAILGQEKLHKLTGVAEIGKNRVVARSLFCGQNAPGGS